MAKRSVYFTDLELEWICLSLYTTSESEIVGENREAVTRAIDKVIAEQGHRKASLILKGVKT